MKTLLTILFISLLSTPSWSQILDDLVQREGIYYQKFTDFPFTGEVTGDAHGSLKNGQKDGAWVHFDENGQLNFKGNYKNGKTEGAWVKYMPDGTVWKEYTGTFKNGVKISD